MRLSRRVLFDGVEQRIQQHRHRAYHRQTAEREAHQHR